MTTGPQPVDEVAPTRRRIDDPPRPSRIETQPAPSTSSSATLSPDQITATVASAVIQALELKEQREAGAKAAREVEVDTLFGNRIRNLKLIAAGMTAIAVIVGTTAGVFRWYAAVEVERAAEVHRREEVKAELETQAATHTADQVENTGAHRKLDQGIKDVGILQLEQGSDQRKILLELTPPAKRRELKDKPAALEAAEAKVRRK